MRQQTERNFHFRGKKCSQMYLKINQSVKTLWYGLRQLPASASQLYKGNFSNNDSEGNDNFKKQ